MHRTILLTGTIYALLFLALGGAHARDYPVVERVMLEMSDGTHLATDICYPQDNQDPWPVLLYRTPYGIATDNIGWVADYGYVGISQDCRGRFDSEGVDRMFLDDGWGPDHADGRETVEWTITQPWCNGELGTMGGSARGITQNMLAGSVPPELDCQHVTMAPASMYQHTVFPGGAMRRRDIIGWLTGQGSAHMLDSLVAHPNYDDYWTYLDTQSRDLLITVPTYQVGGWYDLFADGQVAKFLGLQFNGGPGARGNQKLIMGPWTHGGGSGELVYPANSGQGNAEALIGNLSEWLNYWMHGIPNGIMDEPAIAYYLMGDVDDPAAPGNEWRTSENWPPAGMVEEVWYLHEGGVLDQNPPAPGEAPAGYSFDPYDPVPTRGGGNLIGLLGPYDQRPVEDRPDVVLYTSDVLTTPVTICGPVRLTLYAASNRIDTDFTAKLSDVYPDGRSMLVCDGIIRARHRLSMGSEDFLIPNLVYEFEILVGNTALSFNEGHRIRLAVSSSNFDRFDVNPNTGEPFALEYDEMFVAFNTLRQDSEYPSHLTLPVIREMSAIDPLSPADELRLLKVLSRPGQSPALVSFSLGSVQRVTVDFYDLGGRRLSRLAEAVYPPGAHTVTWSARDAAGRPVSSGIYLVRVSTENAAASAKVPIVR